MKKLSNTKMILGATLAVILANPALVARADGEKQDKQKVEDVAGAAGEQAPPPPAERNYYWTTGTGGIERSGPGHSSGSQEKGEVHLESTERVQYSSYDPVIVQVPVYRCAETSGNGSSNNWNGYFNVPRDQKAKALADTIKGVGIPTARKLVDDNAFDHKPRSWQDFVSIIDREDDRIPGLYKNVVEKYGADNRAALGYGYTGAQDDCVITGYRNKRTYVETPHDEEVPGSTRYLTFDLDIVGGVLLPAEREVFTVSFAGDKGVWVDAPNYLNDYSIVSIDGSTRDGYAEKLARGRRKLVQPGNYLTVKTYLENGQLTVEANDTNYDGSAAQLGSRTINWTIMQNYNVGDKVIRAGQFTMNGSYTKYQTGVKTTDFGKGRTTLGSVFGGRAAPVEGYAKVTIQYSGSAFYSQQPSSEKKSDKVRLN